MIIAGSFWKPVVEILILWFVIYQLMFFFEGSRAKQVLRGIIILSLAFFLFNKLDFGVLDWLMTKLFGISVIAFLIIFQPEIRQGLAKLGQRHILFSFSLKKAETDFLLKEIAQAIDGLASGKMGALIVIEKDDLLAGYADSGVAVDAKVSAELIQAIFTPNNPLHDGGIIIQQGRIVAAGCLFPLSEDQKLNRIFGTRHRAALGLSEETDAIIIIVSEERGNLSLVCQRKLFNDLSKEDLILKVREVLNPEKK